MKNLKTTVVALLLLVFDPAVVAGEQIGCKAKERRAPSFLETPIKDIVQLNFNLFSMSSLKILICSAPLYAITRGIDDKVHACFYDTKTHKNKNQLHKHCSKVAAKGMAIPIIFFGGCAFFSQDVQLRTTSYVFLLGMPFVIIGKDIIKEWRAEHCKRPKCEWFSKDKCSYGGFPSGHMAEAIYMTVLFGMRYGPRAWIPLSAFSAFVFGAFVNCNRHYVSQLVAGGALGAMYAVAANKIVDAKLAKNLEFSCGLTPKGMEIKTGITF